MVRIVKGEKTRTIPKGAMKTYLSTGWTLAEDKASHIKAEQAPATEPEYTEEVEEEEDVEYIDPEDLLNRPLSELDLDELRILAEYKGIDTSNLNTSKRLRAAISSLD